MCSLETLSKVWFCSQNCYDHGPKQVEESDECKLLWDFPIQADHKIEHNKPDIVVVNKKERSLSNRDRGGC